MNDLPDLCVAGAASMCEVLSPIVAGLLRFWVGFALIPHGLRITFGFFPNTGVPSGNLRDFSRSLSRMGYRPGWLWAPLISFTQLVCGTLLALGLFTRYAALTVFVFLFVANFERWRIGRYFSNQQGLEYTVMWTIAALYFAVTGGGYLSLDHLLWDKR
jgi:putative oxidoreductase